MQKLKDIVKITFDQVGLCGLWQATYASYAAYEVEASQVDWASPWEEQNSAMLADAYEHSFAVWEGKDTLPYYLVIGARTYQEIDLSEQPLQPTCKSEEEDHEEGYLAIGRPTAFLRQQKNIEDISGHSQIYEFEGDAVSETATKLRLYHWNDDDETWQCDILSLEGDELIRWSYTTYQWIYVQSIETRYRRI